ncbi:hypothetical protein H4219_000096 [Mycoemilia scoparia]|uniref:Prefoldin subunit 1 n=1 Tax=Mycoemilia scoparia TaxID=417184 RepID=A0A9W8A4G0_9FUNG|nr:hypothetical protein H4219_000096 [Mycoemilia scoparia]
MSGENIPELIGRIQERLENSHRQLVIVDTQLSMQTREARKAELTLQELSTMDAKTPMYLSVSKMFVMEDQATIKKNLDKQIKDSKETISALEKKKKYFEREMKGANDNLTDLIRSTRPRG